MSAKSQTKTAPAADPKAAGMIRAIKAGRKVLGLDDRTYKDFLFRETGRDSCDGMSRGQLGKVLDAMRAAGFGRKDGTDVPAGQIGMIRALWREMHVQGIVRNPDDPALDAYAIRICKRPVSALTVKQSQALIETMKKWWDREAGITGAAKLHAMLAGPGAGMDGGTGGGAEDSHVPR